MEKTNDEMRELLLNTKEGFFIIKDAYLRIDFRKLSKEKEHELVELEFEKKDVQDILAELYSMDYNNKWIYIRDMYTDLKAGKKIMKMVQKFKTDTSIILIEGLTDSQTDVFEEMGFDTYTIKKY